MRLSIWEKCILQLQKKISNTEFNKWINPLQAEIYNNTLIIYAPNKFVLEIVKKKYLNKIHELLNIFFKNKIPILKFQIGNKSSYSSKKIYIYKDNLMQKINKKNANYFIKSNKSLKKKNIFYNSYTNPKYNFENFITGKSNQLAYDITKKIAHREEKQFNPVFIYGDTGLGKTHLLHAINNYININKINIKTLYVNSENFVCNMIKAIKDNVFEKFKYYYRSTNILLIDDIHFFANKEKSQEELLYTFNFLIERNQQIVVTSNKYPNKIKGIKKRLKSRFNKGLIILIHPPDLNTRINILIKKSKEHKICLSKKLTYSIAKNINSNVCELEGIINYIIANRILTNCKMNSSLIINKLLTDLIFTEKKKITIDSIKKTVCKYYKIEIKDLISKKRTRTINQYRQIAIALIKKFTRHSLSEIGNAFGKRNHTNILYAYKKINKICNTNNDIKKDFIHLTNILLKK